MRFTQLWCGGALYAATVVMAWTYPITSMNGRPSSMGPFQTQQLCEQNRKINLRQTGPCVKGPLLMPRGGGGPHPQPGPMGHP